MEKFLVNLLLAFLEKVGVRIANAIALAIAERKLKGQSKQRVKEIQNEKNPHVRARRMRDLLNDI